MHPKLEKYHHWEVIIMRIYGSASGIYDLLDVLYFTKNGVNPRRVIMDLIPNAPVKILDMCCGTCSNTLMIAKEKQLTSVIGVDISPEMLNIAQNKAKENNISNLLLMNEDATHTSLSDSSFDFIIIGLVLHEISPALTKQILKEAYRLLKPEGRAIILEWEKQTSLLRRIKFSPILLMEKINSKTFTEFYHSDKNTLFAKYNFNVKQIHHCDYSIVVELIKDNYSKLDAVE